MSGVVIFLYRKVGIQCGSSVWRRMTKCGFFGANFTGERLRGLIVPVMGEVLSYQSLAEVIFVESWMEN